MSKLLEAIAVGTAALLLGTALPAFAKNASGTCGEGVSWTYDNGVLTISGEGEIEDSPSWSMVPDDITSVVIEEGITVIGDSAFSFCDDIESVSFPSTLTEIGDSAFSYCDSLEAITIPGSVQKFGDDVFYGTSLTSVIFEDGIEEVWDGAFSFCEELESVTLPASVTEIGDSAFSYCDSLETFTIPATVTDMGDDVFYASGLETVVFAEGCTEVWKGVFSFCDSIETVILPSTIKEIGKSAFSYCDGLKIIGYCGTESQWLAIKIGSSNDALYAATLVCNYVFPTEDDSQEATEAVLTPQDTASAFNIDAISANRIITASGLYGSNITWSLDEDGLLLISGSGELGDDGPWRSSRFGAFSSLVIEDGITVIGDEAFRSCDELESISIPQSVVEIGDRAFYYCESLEHVTIPGSVADFGEYVFYGSGLTSVILEEGIKAIWDEAFRSCEDLESVTIPSSVTEIGDRAFYYCESLETFTLPATVTEFGEYVFYESGLTTLIIADGVTEIWDEAFRSCDKLESVTIPSSVTEIGDRAFYYCDNLENVYYTGNEEQWLSIDLGKYNDGLNGANLTCNYTSNYNTPEIEGDSSAPMVGKPPAVEAETPLLKGVTSLALKIQELGTALAL